MKDLRSRIDRFFFAPATAEPVAFLRISLGIMMLIESIGVSRSIDDLYGPLGFMQAKLMRALAGPLVPYYSSWIETHGFAYSDVLHIFYLARFFALILFTVGLLTRTSTIFLCLTQAILMNSGVWSSYGVDRYFHLLLFILIFCPAGDTWSVDRWLKKQDAKPTEMARFALRLLQISILVTYLDAGVSKGMGRDWWSGEAIWRVTNLPDFQQFNFMWMASAPWLPKVLGWATIFFETFYFIGVCIEPVALGWTLIIMSMHIGIALFMGLVNFGITMALINACLFFYPRLKRMGSRTHHQTRAVRIDPFVLRGREPIQ